MSYEGPGLVDTADRCCGCHCHCHGHCHCLWHCPEPGHLPDSHGICHHTCRQHHAGAHPGSDRDTLRLIDGALKPIAGAFELSDRTDPGSIQSHSAHQFGLPRACERDHRDRASRSLGAGVPAGQISAGHPA